MVLNKKKAHIIEEDGCQIRVVHLDRVKKARRETIPPRELNRLSLIFKALGDISRLKIALALQAGEMCVCDLAAYLNLSDSAVSHQLRYLKDLALVKARRDGQVLYYSLDDDHVDDLFRIGLDHVRE